MTELRAKIDAVRSLARSATAGPWRAEQFARNPSWDTGPALTTRVDPDEYLVRMSAGKDSTILLGPDARFIAAARELLPELAEACAELLDERDAEGRADVRQVTAAMQASVEARDVALIELERVRHVVRAARRLLEAQDALSVELETLDSGDAAKET